MKFDISGVDTAKDPAHDRIEGKRILVTGAGGSIGSALARRLVGCDPSSLILLDHSEYALYELERGLQLPKDVETAFVLGSAGDEDALASIFAKHRPQVVFHAAAFKHVPLLERNPFAAIGNNVLGTYTLMQVAIGHGVEEFVQVSTDKAVDPHSIMGASKRIAELLLIAHEGFATRMSAVRLGNVWASQGSVVELFLDQIAQGGPLTVTDADASRFFMTMEEAVAAILAVLDARSGGTILVPRLGEPVRIVDLAERLLREHKSVASLRFTGLRPGDKLTESLISSREAVMPDEAYRGSLLRHVASHAPSMQTLLAGVASLSAAVKTSDLGALLDTVCRLVPEYMPSFVLSSLRGAKHVHEESHA